MARPSESLVGRYANPTTRTPTSRKSPLATMNEQPMRERPADLPDFDVPPLQEVAIGLQFDPTPGYAQAHVGAFWQRIKADYPRVSDQMRLESPIEVPGSAFPSPMPFRVQFGTTLPRAWFLNEDESFLIQLQDDRFIHNWRKKSSYYPRFESLAEQFIRRYGDFASFLDEEKLRAPVLRQLEVTYINWIPVLRIQEFLRPTADQAVNIEGLRPQEPGNMWRGRYTVLHEGSPVGSLTAEAAPGKLPASGEQGHQFVLAARVLLTGSADIESMMFRARNDIVRTFHALTREEMHDMWGYRR